MIKITYANSIRREEVIFDENKTIREFFEVNNGVPQGCTISLDGFPLLASDLDKKIKEFSGNNDAILINAIAKTDNN